MIDLDVLPLRVLQLEAARIISSMEDTNDIIYNFNKESRHDSTGWYKAAITWYVKEYGGMPSEIGPGKNVEFIYKEAE
jgi:hypothetical protein